MGDLDLKRAFRGGGNGVTPSNDVVLGALSHAEEQHLQNPNTSPQRGEEAILSEQERTLGVQVRGVNNNKRLMTDWIVSHTLTMTKNFINSAILWGLNNCSPQNDSKNCVVSKSKCKVAFTEPSRGMSGAKVEQTSAETLSFRCVCERCRLMRGEVGSKRSKAAFTLAEVLITLAIIGVVAALTIPSLIEKYKQQVIISKLNKVYSVISQAYISAKNDNGEIKNWNLKNYGQSQNNDEDILYYLLPYLKVQKFCGKKEKGCFPDVRYGSIGSTGFGINLDSSDWYSKAVLDDGTVIASITFSDVDGVIRIDVNGSNPPNILGIDLFSFYFNSNKIVPLGIYGVGAASPTNSFYINRGDYCTAWVIYGKTMDYIKDKKCEPYK